jgi:hypothetical protein
LQSLGRQMWSRGRCRSSSRTRYSWLAPMGREPACRSACAASGAACSDWCHQPPGSGAHLSKRSNMRPGILGTDALDDLAANFILHTSKLSACGNTGPNMPLVT